MRSRTPRRRGNVTCLVALSLVAILSFVALAVDGGMMLDKRRQMQAAADAASLAAAGDLYQNYLTNKGLDVSGTAKQTAIDTASANGYTDGVNGCHVYVYFYPNITTSQSNHPAYCEVQITFDHPRYFSAIFGRDVVTIGVRSVARGARTTAKNAIITLNPTAYKGSFNAGGNGLISVTGANIQVNSTDASAMIANGNGTVTAPEYDVTGAYNGTGYTTPGGGSFGNPPNVVASPQIADPLQFLPAPDPSTMVTRSTKKLQVSSSNNITLQPGLYIGGIAITGNANVTLMPGIYYMQGGGFTVSGGGSLTGTGVMIYNNPTSNSDTISISGSGNVTLSPPTSGTYQGVLLFQNREATAPVSVSGAQGAILSISGTFYAASATLNVTGNGTQQTIGSQYISYNLVLGGNGNYSVSWDPTVVPGLRELRIVE